MKHEVVFLLTMIDRSFGGSTKDLGVFSTPDKLEAYVYRKYSRRYAIESISDGYSLTDSMTGLMLYVREFVVDEYF